MTFRKMLVLPVAALLTLFMAAGSVSAFQTKAVDLTGVWTGTFTRSDGNPTGAHLDLKQKGAELTGTAGPDLNQQVAIANGKITTEKGVTSVVFEATQPSGLTIKFDLKLVDGRLKGKAIAEANGEKREATLDVGRKQ